MQRLYPRKEFRRAFDGRQRIGLELLQPGTEQLLGAVHELGFGQVHLDQVGLELLDQLFQRRGDFGDRQDAGHVRAALERMQRTLQGIGHRLRQLLGTVSEKPNQGIEMGLGFVAEDLQ